MDEDVLYKEFLNEILKYKKNDLSFKGFANFTDQRNGKDIYVS